MGSKAVSSRKRKRVQQQTVPELLDEIVWEILIRLPVESLGRFTSVSKAWHAIISDPVFVRAHLRFSKQKQQQDPTSFLITPQVLLEPGTIKDSIAKPFSTNIRFYRWDLREGSSSTASLLYRRHFPAGEFGPVSLLAHCDGLVLLPTSTKAYVFNPAMKDAIALPESRRNRMAHDGCLPVGFGFDPSTGRYKVARSFYRCSDYDPTGILAMGMEVFTIGAGDGSWRETSADPPYPVYDSQTGKHYEGHLFYFMSKSSQHHQPPPGLLRFSLQDETFGVTLFPSSMDPTVQDHEIHVNELDGELSVSYLSEHSKQLVIWMTRDVLNPKWDCRYVINGLDQCCPVASLGSMASLGGVAVGILFRCGSWLFRDDLTGRGIREDELFDMDDLRYLGPGEDTLGRAWENVCWYDAISYTESLVPITQKRRAHRSTINVGKDA